MAYMDNKDLANTQISERREKEIAEAVSKVMEAADAAAKGRPVRVIAATKTRDVGEVMAAIKGRHKSYRRKQGPGAGRKDAHYIG